jgi:hypothetical protein
MSISKQKIDTRQITIFDYLERRQAEREQAVPRAGALDIDRRFRETVSDALKHCKLSRFGVAARMSELCGVEITKSQLDSWTAESKESHRFPAIYLPAFCEAVGSTEPLVLLSELMGVFVLPGPTALRAEIRKIEEEISVKQKEKRKRMMFLSEMERS